MSQSSQPSPPRDARVARNSEVDPGYTVEFTRMADGTEAEYLALRDLEQPFVDATADRLLATLAAQETETIAGYKVTRLTHGLQSATRAWRDGADEDWVVGALVHDIGDGLSPRNHDEMAAAILRPFLREQVVWCVQHHGVFQMVYYAHHYGWDRNAREAHKDSPYYQDCVEFCAHWDQESFDPDYPTFDLEFFAPIVREVFARTPYAVKTVCPGVRLPLRDAAVAASREIG